jgi:hypothetical protein
MMQSQAQEKADSLKALANAFFHRQLTTAEEKLLEGAALGQVAHCGPSPDPKDRLNNPRNAEKSERSPGWKRDREIDADLIRWLSVYRKANEQVDPRGLQIQAAKITGNLDLADLLVPFPIGLRNCALNEDANLVQVQIPRLDLGGSWIKAIAGDGAIVKGGVFLNDGFHADGEVQLPGAQIDGDLVCKGGTFNNPEGYALTAYGAVVKGNVFLSEGFQAYGEVNLSGARVGGSLECSGTFSGEVTLPGAQIDGDLVCKGGTFKNPEGYALTAYGAVVKGNVFLSEGFHADGRVNLLNAQIGANLECEGGIFNNAGGDALFAGGANVSGAVFLSEGFNAKGTVSLYSAHIDGDLICKGGILRDATLDLRDAKVSRIRDDENSWPQPGHLVLDGFVYQRFAEGPKDAETRLKWLALQPKKPFATGPYLQLAKVLRAAGEDDGAARVMVEMEDRRRANNPHNWFEPVESVVLKRTIGYGFRPLLAFWEVLGLTAVGWILYRRSYLAGGMVPAEKEACRKFKDGHTPTHYEPFSPLVYSVENSLPLVKLGQFDKWQPDPDASTPPPRKGKWAGRDKPWPRALRWLERGLVFVGLLAPVNLEEPPSWFSRVGTSSRFLRWCVWAHILLGWLLATLFVAGVTGIIRKE